MYGNKKTFRLIGSISGIALSAGLLIGSIAETSMIFSRAYFDIYWLTIIYVLSIFLGIVSLVFSIMLCVNKAPKGMAIALIAISGFVAMSDLAYIILLNNFFTVMNMMLWIMVIVMLSIYLGTKEGVPPSQNKNVYIPNYGSARPPVRPAPAPQKEAGLDSKISVLDKLKAEGKLTDEEYKALLIKMLEQ